MDYARKIRKRALNTGPQSVVAKSRYLLYKYANEKISKAIENGFYLEAITLEESIISDRLEAYLFRLTKENKYDFKPLGELLIATKKLSQSNEVIKLCEEIDVWRDQRNKMLHEFVKIEVEIEIEEIIKKSELAALKGKYLAGKVSKVTRKLITKIQKEETDVANLP